MKTFRSFFLVLLLFLGATAVADAQMYSKPKLDVPYVPTSRAVVDAMLKLANVTQDDVLYDLGCGDGRIVITAAKKYGATGTGVDIDPQRIHEANENARTEEVTDKVKFVEGNLFEMDLSDATVVTMYLLPSVNLKLRPRLLEQLKPGTRIVSHAFDMGDWEPEQTVLVNGSTIYLWTIPEK
ncbi:class I SAM-dependent methyltransferase [Botryobacter ruber]|uniref:class I SAM-dependent methyltransferase n=1 Tax=Botryobacter ruber TaxID=2171629 RepID=UPI000E0A9418|nr:class I SAM-dependent methyltransferase [Botryobacter ruber]